MKRISLNKILKLLSQNNTKQLKKTLNESFPEDIAYIINNLPDDIQCYLFNFLNFSKASEVIYELYEPVRKNIIDHLKKNQLAKIIDEMDSDEATDIVAELKDDITENILKSIDKKDSEAIRALLKYDEETAGGIMQTEIIAVNEDKKRNQLIEYIRENKDKVDNIHYVFVVDKDKKLKGILDIVNIMVASDDIKAKDIMETDIISVKSYKDQEEVANIFRKFDIYALPVVNDREVLLGRITVDDIIDVIDEEASEDAYLIAGLDSEDKVFSSPFSSVRKRIPWLTLNLLTALIVSSVVGIFEETIAKLSFLAVLMPIVAGLGGNSATQTLTVITRGIAMGELSVHNTYKAILKEILVGLTNGIIIGTIVMLIAYFLKNDILLGVVLGSAMVSNMFIAGLCGSLIPTIMKKFNLDPALASSVLITMLTDIGGFASFLGLASILLV
mgnify:CR=1 FL=1